jgi:uracil phosphoribosyltransferase
MPEGRTRVWLSHRRENAGGVRLLRAGDTNDTSTSRHHITGSAHGHAGLVGRSSTNHRHCYVGLFNHCGGHAECERTLGQLEYGVDSVEMHEDALTAGENVLIIDDLIATGGTALAAVKLIEGLGATVVGASFVIDLPDLGGMRKLLNLGLRAEALCAFEGH